MLKDKKWLYIYTNSKADFIHKNRFQMFGLKISVIQNLIWLRFGMTMYTLTSDFFEKDNKYVLKARNLCY